VRISKCLDRDDMVLSRICMSKGVDLSNMLFFIINFVSILWIAKRIQNRLLFLIT